MSESQKFTQICADILLSDRSTLSNIEYTDLCSKYEADSTRMDNLFYAAFGMSAEEVIMECARCV